MAAKKKARTLDDVNVDIAKAKLDHAERVNILHSQIEQKQAELKGLQREMQILVARFNESSALLTRERSQLRASLKG